MAIDKPLEPFTEQELSDAFGAEDPDEIEVEIEQPLGDEEDDGSLIVQLSGDGEVLDDMYEDHDANLADYIDEDVLGSMASELVQSFEADRTSRSDWATAYVKGLDMLGMKIEDRTQPWEGASGVYHPCSGRAQLSAYGPYARVSRRDGADAVPPAVGGFFVQEGVLRPAA
jgi:hypothetical protein